MRGDHWKKTDQLCTKIGHYFTPLRQATQACWVSVLRIILFLYGYIFQVEKAGLGADQVQRLLSRGLQEILGAYSGGNNTFFSHFCLCVLNSVGWGSVIFRCGSGSPDPYLLLMDPNLDPTSDPTPFFGDFKDAKKKFITYPQAHYLQS